MCWHFCQGSLSRAVRLVLPMTAVILVAFGDRVSVNFEPCVGLHLRDTNDALTIIIRLLCHQIFSASVPLLMSSFHVHRVTFCPRNVGHFNSRDEIAAVQQEIHDRLSGVGGTIVQVDSSGFDRESRNSC